MVYNQAELHMFRLTFFALAACTVLAIYKGIAPDFASFSGSFATFCGLMAIGQFYRKVRPDERIASVVTAVAFLMFTGHVFSVLTYLHLPYLVQGGDQFFEQIDSHLGFHWSTFVVAVSDYPAICEALRLVYLSSAWQIAAAILALGLVRRYDEIGALALAILVGAAVTTEVWALFPSSTPAAFQPLPADVAARLGLVVSPEQGAWLARISHEGLTSIGAESMVGIVGFPSYHTVLTFTTLYFAWTITWLRWPLALHGMLMVPAILVHGSHNVIDVFGGLAVTVAAIVIAKRLVCYRPGQLSDQLEHGQPTSGRG